MAANPLKGEVGFTAGGADYVLVYDDEAVVVLENALDLSVFEFPQHLTGVPKFGFLRTLLWGGLQRHHPKLSLAEAGALLKTVKAVPALEFMTDALKLAFPSPAETEGASGNSDPQETAGGTGQSSTPSTAES